MLYLSLHLKQNRDEYYRLLQGVRSDGDWEAWLAFFLKGVQQTADGAVGTAKRLIGLFADDRTRIQEAGRVAGSALRVHMVLQERPVARLKDVAEKAGLSFPAASAGMKLLEDVGVAQEITGRRRNRLFRYGRYIEILNEGTEPL